MENDLQQSANVKRLPQVTLDYLQLGTGKGDRNNTLFAAVAQMRDAGYSLDEITAQAGGRALSDGLPQGEVDATIRSAWNGERREPIGGRGKQAPAHNDSRQHQPPKPAVKPAAINPEDIDAELPEIKQPTVAEFLQRFFKPGEIVNFAIPVPLTESDKPYWHKDLTWPLEKLLSVLNESGREGGLDWWKGVKDYGAWFSPNPAKNECAGRKDNAAEFRHVMFEADGKSKSEQMAIYRASNLPIRSVVDSGGDSLHALVRVDAANSEEYKVRAARYFAHF